MAVRNITSREYEKLEPIWSALPEDEQPHLVVFMGILGYKVVAVCDTEDEAQEVLALWERQRDARASRTAPRCRCRAGRGRRCPGTSRCARRRASTR